MMFFLVTGVFSAAAEWTPGKFQPSERISVIAHALRSPVRPMPLDFYIDDIFCRPKKAEAERRTIGQSLTGELFQVSPFEFQLGEKADCKLVCKRKLNDAQRKRVIELIDSKYKMFLSLDNVPLGTNYTLDGKGGKPALCSGFEIGFVRDGHHYLRNNLKFVVRLSSKKGRLSVTGFDLAGATSNSRASCFKEENLEVAVEDAKEIPFTYSVEFQYSKDGEPVRLDRLLEATKDNPTGSVVMSSLLSIGVSAFVVVFLIFRTACKTKKSDDSFDEYDGCEWKLIHGDVFRGPNHADDLSMNVGWGVQIFLASIFVLLWGKLQKVAFISNAAVLDTFVTGLVLTGAIGGFVSGKLFRTIGSANWRRMLLRTTFKLSLQVFVAYWVIYLVGFGASCSFSLSPILIVITAVVIGLPLFIGTLVGLNSQPLMFPQKVNQLPRQIPPNSFVGSDLIQQGIAGSFMALAVAAQVHDLMVSSWTGTWFEFQASTLLVGVLAIICQSVAVGVVIAYIRVSHENYHWWWPSYSSAAAVFPGILLYALYFANYTYVPDSFRALFIFLVACSILAYIVSKAVGAASFLGALVFVDLIYNSLKIE